MTTRLILLTLLLTATPAFAEYDSISTGLRIVEEFYTETTASASSLGSGPRFDDFKRLSLDRANKAASELRSTRWAEAPGQRRFQRAYGIVESYIAGQMKAFEDLTGGVKDKARAREALEKLRTIRDRGLEDLKASLKAETYEGKKIKPVPSIDTPPQEDREGTGIWYR